MEQMKKDAAEKLNRILELQETIGKYQQAIKPLREESSRLEDELQQMIDSMISQANTNGILKEKQKQDIDNIWDELNRIEIDEPKTNITNKTINDNPLVLADLLLNIADAVSKNNLEGKSNNESKGD